jgi:putative ABC transport system permease protein
VTRVALRNLFSRKLRTGLTALAIILGVAMVSGTYVLTDSINRAFDAIFTSVYVGTDATITGKTAFDVDQNQNTTTPPSFDESLLVRVRDLPEVKDAVGGVAGEAQLIGNDGKVITFGGAPNLGFSVDASRPTFESLKLVDGRWPGLNEVVIDKSTAGKKDLNVGDEIGVQAQGPQQRVRIAGLVTFGSVSTIGGATLAGFDLPTAQKLFEKPGKLDQIRVSGKDGVSPQQLVNQIRGILPADTQVRTGTAQAKKDAEGTNQFLSFLQKFLLAFGGIALFVGSFVIANSLSITIAQRTREYATLRTLGASRRQVLRSIIVEALVIGTTASVIGLFLGLLLAKGLFKLFDAFGFTLPNSGLTFLTRTIVVSLLVGIVVTLLASLRPALRATRVPPIAAVREGAELPPGRFARFRTPASAVLAVLGFAALVYGLFGNGLGTTAILIWMGLGTLLVFFGVALLSVRIVKPLALTVAPPAKWLLVIAWLLFLVLPPGWVYVAYHAIRYRALPTFFDRSSAAEIARDNAARNPQRTASTASALMIGLALVTLVAVLASGIVTSFKSAVNDLFTGDYAITAENNFSPIPIAAGNAAARARGVLAVGDVRAGDARVFDKRVQLSAVDPGMREVIGLDWKEGSQAVLGSLGRNGAFVDDGFAKEHHLSVGSPIRVETPRGRMLDLRLRGVFKSPSGGSPFGAVTISTSTFDRNYDQPKNLFSFVRMRGGETEANRAALEETLKSFPNAKVQTRQEFIDNQIAGLTSVLNILYVLLALSIVVSVFGIVNTLVLTVFERTREIGMLRAIGMTRRQVRRMIRQEAVIVALIGAVTGIALGIVLGALLVARVDFIVFSLPITSLVIFAIASVIVGIVAAILPARRAAKLNPLEALSYE